MSYKEQHEDGVKKFKLHKYSAMSPVSLSLSCSLCLCLSNVHIRHTHIHNHAHTWRGGGYESSKCISSCLSIHIYIKHVFHKCTYTLTHAHTQQIKREWAKKILGDWRDSGVSRGGGGGGGVRMGLKLLLLLIDSCIISYVKWAVSSRQFKTKLQTHWPFAKGHSSG